MDINNPPPDKAADESTPAPRNVWETVLTTTPVVLTVLATLLAGLSNSEMIQAQYFRSLAAQSQSKAGDQWGFFQAKRIRGTSFELSIAQLPVLARAGHFDPDGLLTAAVDVARGMRRADRGTEQLERICFEHRKDLASRHYAPLREAADNLRKTTILDVAATGEVEDTLTEEITEGEPRQSITYLKSFLDSNQPPPVKSTPIEDPRIREALEGISQRKTDEELAPVLRQIDPEAIRQALATVQADADAFEQECQTVSKALNRIDQSVSEELTIVRAFHQSVGAVEAALAEVAALSEKVPSLGTTLSDIRRADAVIGSAAEALYHRFLEVQQSFTARRYSVEAVYNKKAADLYEVQVRKHSTTSDRHRLRSQQFFYGMLCAQAGVTVSSLSLAARKRNVLWALAGLAGLVALGFSLFVYLFV